MGYTGAGIGINQTRNQLIAALRAQAERGNPLLIQTWQALQHVTLDTSRITAAALVLLHLQRGAR